MFFYLFTMVFRVNPCLAYIWLLLLTALLVCASCLLTDLPFTSVTYVPGKQQLRV